ncbi:MAG: protein kinase [Hyphomicrobium sp.]|jgi:serine/threonine protein kinase
MTANDDTILQPGTRIDQYVITGLLGRGGFGITYLIKDELLDKEFALKEFFPEELVRRDGKSLRFLARTNAETDYHWGRKKFFDEARLLAQFNHPNIVGVRRVFESNDTAYMVLDLIRGITLEKWLKGLDSRPTQDELDLVAAPLLSALQLVHENRTWHLDISPDNVMIRASDGAPLLLDFGASRFEIKQHSQLVSALVFKSGYSAPEQYTSNADRYGAWTDIYAFGAMLYRAVTGSRPPEATSRQLADDMKPAVVAAKGHYRESFLAAIDAALRLQPALRPQSISDWSGQLLKGSTGTPANDQATSAAAQWQRTVLLRPAEPKKQKWKLIVAALAALAISAATVIGLLLPQPISRSLSGQCGGLFSEPCWGAVVDKGGNIFARVEEKSKASAETAALKKCADKFTASDCSVIATITKNECWVLAEVPNDPARWKASSGASIAAAEKNAKWDCERAYTTCQVALTFCADGRTSK